MVGIISKLPAPQIADLLALGNDYFNAEWGYISFAELQSINVNGIEIDCELNWKICKASEIEKIRISYKQQK